MFLGRRFLNILCQFIVTIDFQFTEGEWNMCVKLAPPS